MTEIYFVRHCQSQKGWKESDRIRPLTVLGKLDSSIVTLTLQNVHFDYCVCSPYNRSINTINECAIKHNLFINQDERLKERLSGPQNDDKYLKMRWENHDYCEPMGETLNQVQKRNIQAIKEILTNHKDQTILVGTHGTALSTIINYYEPTFGYEDFQRLYTWLPYIIHFYFDGDKFVKREDVLIVNRGY